jgi:hypothetical protein
MENRNIQSALVVVGLVAAASGCGIEKPVGGPSESWGTVQVALTATTPQGTTYRVRDARLDIFNFDGACPGFPCASISADDDTVDVDLPVSTNPFDYSISLEPGWSVFRVETDGAETLVAATLISNYIPFTIKPDRKTPVRFQFQIGTLVATTGTGTVDVRPEFLETLIDDFEDGDDQLAPFGGRNGTWTAFNDGSGVETPAPGARVLPEVLDTSANEWLHLTGRGFGPVGRQLPDGTFSYGAGVFANLVVDPVTGFGKPYDASTTTGVGFKFVMKAPANAPIILSFFVQTSATVPIDQGGTCPFNCYDGFGINGLVPADPNGFTFEGVIPWQFMRQVGYGTPAAFDPSTIMSVNWLVSFADQGQPLDSNAFDLAIDDVVFAAGSATFPPKTSDPDAGVPPPPPPGGDDAGAPGPDAGPPGPDAGPPPKGPPVGPKAARALAAPTWSWSASR